MSFRPVTVGPTPDAGIVAAVSAGFAAAMGACAGAGRAVRRSPIFSSAIIVTIALCIGVISAAYSVVRHLLLAPLPYEDANRIVRLQATPANETVDAARLSGELFRLYASRARTLQEFAAVRWNQVPIGAARDGVQDSASVAMATPSLLPMMRVRPALGRWFTPDDARAGAYPVVSLSDEIWRGRYASDSGVIGRVIRVDGALRTIIGVEPPNVGIPTQSKIPVDIWLPLDIATVKWVDVGIARLRPGITSAAASRDLQTIRLSLPDTGWLKQRRGEALTPAEQVPPRQRHAVTILFMLAVCLLLLACADIAGLFLMRGWARRHELAIRLALGASRGRVARELLAESLLLATAGGAIGLLLAWLGLRAAVALRPTGLDFLASTHLDSATLAWTAVAAAGTGLLFGLGPLAIAWRTSLNGALRAGAQSTGRGGGPGRAHAGLVVVQIAFSVIFVASAGAAVRSFLSLTQTPIGYQPDRLFEVKVRRTAVGTGSAPRPLTPAERAAALRSLRESIASSPDVEDVSLGMLPLSNAGPGPAAVEETTGERTVDIELTGLTYVGPDYFRVARIPIVRGRGFDADANAAAHEVIINALLAHRLWPDRDAVGARLRDWSGEWLTVAGIAGDVQMPGSKADYYHLQLYRAGITPGPVVSLVLRTRENASTLRASLARAVERAGIGAVVVDLVSAQSTLEYAFAEPRFAASLFGLFALVAVLLSATGLFGLVGFAVTRRTHEIGVRMALGANPARVGRLILGYGLRLALGGCAIGLAGAYIVTRSMSAMLYDVEVPGPLTLAESVLVLTVVALAASFVPVRRAVRVDPARALRAE